MINKITMEILEKEKKYKVLNLKINNIYVWKLIRFKLYLEIASKQGFLLELGFKVNKNYKVFFKNLLENTFKKNQKSRELYFISSRFQIVDNKYKEIYLNEIFEKNKSNSELIYMPLTEKKIKNKEYTYSSIEDFNFIFCEISKKFRKIDIKQEELYKISKIKKELEEELGVSTIKILEQKSIIKILKKFKSEYYYYKRFLKKRQCEQIYLVCSYGREALIAAAQDLNIEVIEIQHGVINKYHLGYNFPNSDKVPYFPNKILLFGEYWYENTKLPLKKDQVQIVGYSYMNQQINKYRGKILEKKDQILFISQPASGIEISEKAVEFAKLNRNYNVIVRLHPKEWDNWRNDYKILYENRDLDNLKISDNNNKDLYEYLFESRYIFGIYSTVIYEALYLEKKIGVFNLTGIEHVEDLISKNYIKLFELNEKIELRELDNLEKTSGKYYFEDII